MAVMCWWWAVESILCHLYIKLYLFLFFSLLLVLLSLFSSLSHAFNTRSFFLCIHSTCLFVHWAASRCICILLCVLEFSVSFHFTYWLIWIYPEQHKIYAIYGQYYWAIDKRHIDNAMRSSYSCIYTRSMETHIKQNAPAHNRYMQSEAVEKVCRKGRANADLIGCYHRMCCHTFSPYLPLPFSCSKMCSCCVVLCCCRKKIHFKLICASWTVGVEKQRHRQHQQSCEKIRHNAFVSVAALLFRTHEIYACIFTFGICSISVSGLATKCRDYA